MDDSPHMPTNQNLPPRYAEVVVNVPLHRARKGVDEDEDPPVSQAYHYAIPHGMVVLPGQLVWVSFRSQYCQGVVVALSGASPVAQTKEILQVMDPQPLIWPWQLALARWMSEYYLCSLAEAAFVMLPPGIEQRVVTTFTYLLAPNEMIPAGLTNPQRDLLAWLQRKGSANLDDVRTALRRTGKTDAAEIANQLVRKGLAQKLVRIQPPQVRVKTERMARLAVDAGGVTGDLLESLKRAPKQRLVLEYLRDMGEAPAAQVAKETGAGSQALAALAGRGLVTLGERTVRRDPLAGRDFGISTPLHLTPEQEVAWTELSTGLDELGEGPAAGRRPGVYLLHGVTGSGKTELYLRTLDSVLQQGKQAIVMVPEIALTPQTIHRFASRFPGRVAVLHSKLSMGEHFDEWRRIRDGLADIVIGSRSAVFAPLPRLGLVILDEEHEWTYKQADPAPRYHARQVALKLAELTGAMVVLGSATPEVETYHRASRGEYRLLELPHRVANAVFQGRESGSEGPPVGDGGDPGVGALPPVEVVDMRSELKAGNRSIFSRSLHDAVTTALAVGQQVILFLNRRGTATFIMCRDCGHVLKCRACDTAFSYHEVEDDLVCHRCGKRALVPTICPQCWSKRIKFLGIGTQKVSEEVAVAFPGARVLRWDRDVTGGKQAHEDILEAFTRHKADVLVGTQMIAKGLDLPLVTVVGVVNADVGLYLPDFRAAERTFQLLTQVAGRAGRSRLGGRVIVQTYMPEHYAIQTASRHDYQAFFVREMTERRQRGLPPFSRLVSLTYAASNEERVQAEAERVSHFLRRRIGDLRLPNTDVLSCAPCFVAKLRGRFRWQVVLRGPNPSAALAGVHLPPGWVVDVDPVSLL
jgi:primosomal protein N' (replication factor Y) (superfamily II helicase)